MSRIFELTSKGAVKGTSGLSWKGIERAVKKAKKYLIDTDKLKEFWIAGREGLDLLAASSGIPLDTLRQNYRNKGIDPDGVDTALEDFQKNVAVEDATPESVATAIDNAEGMNVFSSDNVMMGVLIVASIIAFGGFASKRGRKWIKKRYKRFRKWTRRFRR